MPVAQSTASLYSIRKEERTYHSSLEEDASAALGEMGLGV